MNKKYRRYNRKLRNAITFLIILAISVPLFLAIAFKFMQNHFMYNTYIEGVDCSFLTVEQSVQEIKDTLSKKKLFLKFANNKQYEVSYGELDVQIANSEELYKILSEQNLLNFQPKEYYLNSAFAINQTKLINYLKNIEELQPENMMQSQNAFLQFSNDKLLEIVPEVYGNYIKFEEACQIVKKAILSNETEVNFSSIMKIEPMVLSNDIKLTSQEKSINSILKTVINFKLSDNSIYTLDKKIMIDWVYQTLDGTFEIDLKSNVLDFIKNLSNKANEVNSSMRFFASDLGNIDILLQNSVKALVDENAEFEQIMRELGSAQIITRSPIYNKQLLEGDKLTTYIELDITRQKVWMYVDEECILNTPCVTGSVRGGHSTPTGVYYLTYKTTDVTLKGYNNDGSRYASPVNYWMPFNGGIGFHDASWRNKFGGEIYKTNGSHGCVNLPYESAKTLYENINSTIPIIVYKS